MELQELAWLCLVALFLASLLIVLAWLIQYSQTALRLWRVRKTAKQKPCFTPVHRYQGQSQSQGGGVWGFLMRLHWGRDEGAEVEAGVKSLVTSLFSFKTFREHWQRTWVSALNEQACRHGSSLQITFDSSMQLNVASAIESVICTEESAHRMGLHCKCWVDTVTFPVTVTQQSPAAVSMDTCQITIAPMVTQVVVCLEEMEGEGLLMSWTLSKQPSFSLTVSPCKLQRLADSGCFALKVVGKGQHCILYTTSIGTFEGADHEVDLGMIKGLIEDTLFSTQPAMVLDLRTCTSSTLAPMDLLSVELNPVSHSVLVRRLCLRQLTLTLNKGQRSASDELCCVLSLDQPSIERRTCFLSVPTNPNTPLEWSEEITLELGPETKELTVRLLARNGKSKQFLPGHAFIALDLWTKTPSGQHVFLISPGHGLAPNAIVTAELAYVETEEPHNAYNALSSRSLLTPTKKVDVDRTILPDGTIITTVTTVQSRVKVECSPDDSPLRLPSKVEVNEKTPTIVSDRSCSTNLSPSKSSCLSNGLDPIHPCLDPVAETAIRQLTESASKVARKTPTKKSTLIISGVSKVPLSEDDCALSSGYAAAMDATMRGNHFGVRHHQYPHETTPSDVSERPSVDDVESDTASTGALETSSLKDHKVGLLQSGTKLLFRRKHREKESCLSQSHEDISNMDSNFAVALNRSRKKSGNFSRHLIKRFSFRSSVKSKGAGSMDN